MLLGTVFGVPAATGTNVMAYLAFHEFGGMNAVRQGVAAKADIVTTAPASERLTPLEWKVVALARNDSRASLRNPGWRSSLARVLFSQTNPRLADARLEALRRLAVLTWHDGPAVPPHEIRALLDAGFTPEQHRAVDQHIRAVSERDQGTVALL
jgi:hypothetical protein